MTKTEFRNSAEYRSQLQALLDSPVLTVAINCIVEDRLCEDAPLNADAIVSIRLLSKRSGLEEAFRELHLLTTPNPEAPRVQPSDYGSGLNPDQLHSVFGGDLPPPLTNP